MARAIDAYTLNNDLVSWYNDTEDEKEKSILRRVMQRVVQAPTITPPNEALTLEQLREMDGEPVWVKCLKPSQYTDPPERWRILEKSITGHFGVWNGDCALIERNYGTDWLAYRRPPEGEEERHGD